MHGSRRRGPVDPLAETNTTVVRRFVDRGLNGDDHEVFDELVASDVVVHGAPSGFPSGREGWKQNIAVFRAAFPDGRWSIEHLVAAPGKVIVQIRVRGTHQGDFLGIPPTGRSVSWSATDVVRIADGKIVEYESDHGNLGLLQQVGEHPNHGGRAGRPGDRARRGRRE